MDRLDIKRFTSRMLGANTYVLSSGPVGIIVDPCTKVDIIKNYCSEKNILIKQVVLTHCHIDHTLYLNEYLEAFDTVFAIHKEGNEMNMDSNLNGSRLFGMNKSFRTADILLSEGDELNLHGTKVRVIETPGHSPGSICLYSDNVLMSGDTLFNMSIGRSDLPGGNQDLLMKSLEILMELPDETIIYPGHGTFSTIKFERENNPFLYGIRGI
ncbi:MAG: MBL fold metallo-hydrolase [Clostridia bacterium]|nr:MBL fold metallo-hydrolase [Clostridia bacterium]